jgi:hypothetical protein
VLTKTFGTLPHVRWMDADHHGFITLDVARDRLAATFWWVDPEGDGAAVRGRGFHLLPTGRPRLHPVAADSLGPMEAEPVRSKAAVAVRLLGGGALAGIVVGGAARALRRR